MKRCSFTLDDLKKSKVAAINQEIIAIAEGKKPKRSKYGNEKTEVCGELFDSKREADRYKDLKILLKVGEIGLLRRQVVYELNEGGTHSIKYIADFVYVLSNTGEEIVEDVKSKITKSLPVYRLKKKLMKDRLGIEIKEY